MYIHEFLTWDAVRRLSQQRSIKVPQPSEDFDQQQKDILKAVTGNATVNETSLVELKNMVTSEYHTQKLKARDRLIHNAEPIGGGGKKESRGKITGRGSKGPEGVTAQIMFRIILLARAAKYAW